MIQIKPELFTSVIEALYSTVSTDTAEFVGAARNAEGYLNSPAWSQVLTLFLWFGFDSPALYEEVVATTREADPDFPVEWLAMRPADAEFQAMTRAIAAGMSTGLAIEMVGTLRSSLEVMATAIRDCGEPIEPRTLPRLLAMVDGLDEQINLRIEN